MSKTEDRGLPFEVVGTSAIDSVPPGEIVVLDDPFLASMLVASGAIQAVRVIDGAFGPGTELISRGDEMVLLEFARAGLKFDPAEWAPPAKKKGGR